MSTEDDVEANLADPSSYFTDALQIGRGASELGQMLSERLLTENPMESGRAVFEAMMINHAIGHAQTMAMVGIGAELDRIADVLERIHDLADRRLP